MCDIWKHPTKPTEELDPKYYEKLPSGLRINITGGEPMVREDIEEIFKILYPKAQLLELSTNGYFTDRIVKIAEKYPNILIRVSIEGLPALNDRLRGIKDGFDHALRTILELKKTKCKNIGFSIVISPQNVSDLLTVYELSSALGVELGNSAIHNSWYFKKTDNQTTGDEAVWKRQAEFIEALLQSSRTGFQNKIKDYARAYFNISILKRLRGDLPGYRPHCGAGRDFFFIDPSGNILPCNGSEEPWIMGNLKKDTYEQIFHSDRNTEILKRVQGCKRECCFVVTERHEIVRKPWKLIYWILAQKIKLYLKKPLEF
jgi:MoaA/NifB/PqqE/SkfB family radical SAM enzyme